MVVKEVSHGRTRSLGATFATLLAVTISVTLALAAVSKARMFEDFKEVLWASKLFPVGIVPFVAVLVLGAEGAIAAALLHPKWRFGAALGSAGLFSAFAGYSAWRLVAGISAPCSCFGTLFVMTPKQTLMLDVLYLAATTFILYRSLSDRARIA